MPMPTYICDCCKQPFTPSPQNVGRQKYCRRKACRKKRKRDDDNQSYKKRYAEDPVFRAAAKARVKKHRRRLQMRQAQAPPVVAPSVVCDEPPELARMAQAVLGLAAQLGGEDDPAVAVALVDAWVSHGAKMGAGGASGA